MALETATYISGLNPSNPASLDSKLQGDDHLRLIKSTLLATFPNVTGAVTPTHTELNYVDGVTSAIQTQLDAKAPKESPTFTTTATVQGTGGLAVYGTAGDNSKGTVYLGSSGTRYVQFNGSQYVLPGAAVLLDSQPSFHARRTTDQTSGTVVIFDSELHDQGNVYNSGTGVFTAPVAGKYLFSVNLIWRQTTGSSIQGTFYLKQNTTVRATMLTEAFLTFNNHASLHCSIILSLAANDTVTVEPSSALAATNFIYVTPGQSSFSGHLLG